LKSQIPVKIGFNTKKDHKFDLVDIDRKILIECKSYEWTKNGNIPSAKLATLDQTILHFLAASKEYKKILVIKKSVHSSKKETLCEYYVRVNSFLIPKGIEIWEFDCEKDIAKKKF